jgi:pyruvate dehydrogenase E2 component (dihydrolipoamide acetyltransferase)
VNIGVAVDTPEGLIVPVIRDADRKGLMQIAEELAELSGRMSQGDATMQDLSAGTFTVAGLGGTGFTPRVKVPEVAILGVSRMSWEQVWTGDGFEARRMLPLSLSYDHRVIDGAAAARFTAWLARALADVRRLLL